jgi:hypothetical protein
MDFSLGFPLFGDFSAGNGSQTGGRGKISLFLAFFRPMEYTRGAIENT